MIKVICIKNKVPGRYVGYKYLTIGKTYDAEECSVIKCYLITDDNGERYLYNMLCFEPLSLYREKRINQILDEN